MFIFFFEGNEQNRGPRSRYSPHFDGYRAVLFVVMLFIAVVLGSASCQANAVLLDRRRETQITMITIVPSFPIVNNLKNRENLGHRKSRLVLVWLSRIMITHIPPPAPRCKCISSAKPDAENKVPIGAPAKRVPGT